MLYGDYILVNNRIKKLILKLPSINEFNYNANINPTSDHIPITGILQIV
jgi:hypothetical protein